MVHVLHAILRMFVSLAHRFLVVSVVDDFIYKQDGSIIKTEDNTTFMVT